MDANKFVVLVDLDSVVADLETMFLQKFRELFPDEKFIPLEERRTYRPSEQYAVDKVRAVVENDFYRHIKLIPGAKESLEALCQIPHVEVFICSSPLKDYYEQSCAEKCAWVRENLGEQWLNKLIMIEDKTLIYGNVLIDDRHEFDGLVIPQWEHIIFTDCHNKHVADKGRMRLESWLPKENWLGLIQNKVNRWRQRRDYE